MQPDVTSPISDVRLGRYKIYSEAVGDTWDPAWAQDGTLYCAGNDGSGWNLSCSSNVFFNQIYGDDYHHLLGDTSNPLIEYGGWAKKGPDGCTWKSSGCIAVDGVLYFAVARHAYGTESGDPFMRQTAQRASIIKSIDYGRTWVRSAPENYHSPLFLDGRFATPYFIHFGQDGHYAQVDRSNQFIYAISNNGFWCNGDSYILGRVPKEKIGQLNAADWSFYGGGDGARDESWTLDMHQAAWIIDNPLKCGETGATYIPALSRYILIAWFYPGDPNIDTDETNLIFYESPKPWGPWSLIHEYTSKPEGWYCPRLLSRWQVSENSEVSAIMVTGGDYYEMDKYYRFTVVPVRLKINGFYPPSDPEPEILVVDSSRVGDDLFQYQYSGKWEVRNDRKKALNGSERYSLIQNACFKLVIKGKRVRWYASKENNQGIAAVSIDGGEETIVDQYTYCHLPQYGRLLYDSGNLSLGIHSFQVRVTGMKNKNSNGFGISHDRVEITT